MTNSIGIMDESYCGDGDQWRFLRMRQERLSFRKENSVNSDCETSA